MMRNRRIPTPLAALSCLLFTGGLGACSSTSGPAAPPPAPHDLSLADRAADVMTRFGGEGVYVVYEKDRNGTPIALRRVTDQAGVAIEPFLVTPSLIRTVDCLRLMAEKSATGPVVTVCEPTLWRSFAAEGLSPLAAPGGPAILTQLADQTFAHMRQIVSGLTGGKQPTEAGTPPSGSAMAGSAPPATQAAYGVIRLLEMTYAREKTTALGGDPSTAAAFLQTYPGAADADRQAVIGAALLQAINRPTPSAGELRRVLRVLPLTADQKAQGLDALRRLQSLDGWLSALRLGGTLTDLRQARAAAASSPSRHDDQAAEESVALDTALQGADAAARLFRLTPPASWSVRDGEPDALQMGTANLSGAVTLAALPAARLRSGTYDVTVRVTTTSSRSYAHRTPQGEVVQATAHSSTETDVVFTLSPPAYRQTQTVVVPNITPPIAAPTTAEPASAHPASAHPSSGGTPTKGDAAETGTSPSVTLRILSADLRP